MAGAMEHPCKPRVYLRVRPSLAGSRQAICLQLAGGGVRVRDQEFAFEHAFDGRTTQEQVFDVACKEAVEEVVRRGINVSLLTYGQTGSGKTHTLLGAADSAAQRGVLPRAVGQLAKAVAKISDGSRFQMKLSVVEIYCERINDLLNPAKENLQVVADSEAGVAVADVTWMPVANEQECTKVMSFGLANRAVSATSMNAQSSRSHCVVNILVTRLRSGGTSFGKLCLVDLAGSERADRAKSEGLALQEGILINKSLSALGNVVNALIEGKATSHVPYRDSKLTRVLQDSLGGSARTVLIVCCSPDVVDESETVSSLRFGARFAGIKNTVRADAVASTQNAQQLARLLSAAQAEVAQLKAQLKPGGASAPTQQQSSSTAGAAFRYLRVWWLLQLAGLVAYWAAQGALYIQASC